METIYDIPTISSRTGTVATTAEVKKQLNIELSFTDDDTLISLLTDTAIELVEGDTNSKVLDTAVVIEHDLESAGLADAYQIPVVPLKAFTSLHAWVNNAWVAVDSSKYSATAGFHYFTVEILETFEAEKLKFTFSAGYATTAHPKRLKQAVILKAADLYDTERSSYSPNTVNIRTYENLIASHIRRYY